MLLWAKLWIWPQIWEAFQVGSEMILICKAYSILKWISIRLYSVACCNVNWLLCSLYTYLKKKISSKVNPWVNEGSTWRHGKQRGGKPYYVYPCKMRFSSWASTWRNLITIMSIYLCLTCRCTYCSHHTWLSLYTIMEYACNIGAFCLKLGVLYNTHSVGTYYQEHLRTHTVFSMWPCKLILTTFEALILATVDNIETKTMFLRLNWIGTKIVISMCKIFFSLSSQYCSLLLSWTQSELILLPMIEHFPCNVEIIIIYIIVLDLQMSLLSQNSNLFHPSSEVGLNFSVSLSHHILVLKMPV